MTTWIDFIHAASRLGYPHVQDREGLDVIGIPGGYMVRTTDGPAGPRLQVVTSGSRVDYDVPSDAYEFLHRVAPR